MLQVGCRKYIFKVLTEPLRDSDARPSVILVIYLMLLVSNDDASDSSSASSQDPHSLTYVPCWIVYISSCVDLLTIIIARFRSDRSSSDLGSE